MSEDSRPLSPHLQIWRWHISMLTSILHRVSGVVLSVGTVFLTLWLVSLTYGGESFERVQALLSSPFGMTCLFLYNFALFYHLCNGVRHLVWDAGYGFEIDTTRRSAWAVIITSIALTAAVWVLAPGGVL